MLRQIYGFKSEPVGFQFKTKSTESLLSQQINTENYHDPAPQIYIEGKNKLIEEVNYAKGIPAKDRRLINRAYLEEDIEDEVISQHFDPSKQCHASHLSSAIHYGSFKRANHRGTKMHLTQNNTSPTNGGNQTLTETFGTFHGISTKISEERGSSVAKLMTTHGRLNNLLSVNSRNQAGLRLSNQEMKSENFVLI